MSVLHNHLPNVATTSCPACLGRTGHGAAMRAALFPKDTWSFDIYLAGILADGLTQIADRGLGHPTSGVFADVSDPDVGVEMWREILREMALGFRQYHEADAGERTPELDRSLDLLREWWVDLWE